MARPIQCRLLDVDSLCRGKRLRLDGLICLAGRLEKGQTRFLPATAEAAGAARRLPALALRSPLSSAKFTLPKLAPSIVLCPLFIRDGIVVSQHLPIELPCRRVTLICIHQALHTSAQRRRFCFSLAFIEEVNSGSFQRKGQSSLPT